MASRLPNYTSERGTFVYPHLLAPDTKYNADGVYKTYFIPKSEKGTAKIVAQLEEVQEAEYQRALEEADKEIAAATPAKARELTKKRDAIKKQDLPFSEIFDEATGDATGSCKFTFKIVAGGIAKKSGKPYSNKPKMFDSKGKPCSLELFSGAEGKITYIVTAFTNAKGEVFVSLKPKAVQVLKLAGSSGDRTADQFGFEEEDDGFDADQFMAKNENTEDPSQDTGAEDAEKNDLL